MAYDFTGFEQVQIELRAGDVVEWKRNGYRGMATCRVVGFANGKLHLQPIDRVTREDCGRQIAVLPWVSRAWRDGRIVGLPEAFTSVVTDYMFVPADGWGEVTVARPGHRDVFTNSNGPGWPRRPLKVGDQVRVSARQLPGEQSAAWFIE